MLIEGCVAVEVIASSRNYGERKQKSTHLPRIYIFLTHIHTVLILSIYYQYCIRVCNVCARPTVASPVPAVSLRVALLGPPKERLGLKRPQDLV